MSDLSYEAPSSSPVPSDNADFLPQTLPLYLSTLELRNLIKTSEDRTKLEDLLSTHHNLYQWFCHFQSNDTMTGMITAENWGRSTWIIQCVGTRRDNQALAPLVVWKWVERYQVYQVYRQWRSPRSYPLPDSPVSPKTLSLPPLKAQSPSPVKSSSSYHTAFPEFPPLEPGEICCLESSKKNHLLGRCNYSYWWNHVLDWYVAIPHKELKTLFYDPSKDPDVYPELRKTGKSSA